jgi:hypothetical protein
LLIPIVENMVTAMAIKTRCEEEVNTPSLPHSLTNPPTHSLSPTPTSPLRWTRVSWANSRTELPQVSQRRL